MILLKLIGYGQRRDYMPARAPAGQNCSHVVTIN